VVLEKDGEDQLIDLVKNEGILYIENQGGEEYPTHNKMKED
jgi:hypothetical protein